MCVLKFTFQLLTILGCWPPDSCSSPYTRAAYNVYSIVMVVLMNSFLLSQFMDLVLIVDNAEDFSDNFFAMLAIFITCCKLFSVLINRKNIIALLDMLAKKPCRPLRPNEMKIQYKFDKDIETNTWRFVYLGIVTLSFIVLMSVSINFGKRRLTYRAWLPFNYSSTVLYSLTYAHQLISLVLGGFLNIACDSLICGFLVHICCQIEILAYRLRKNMSYSGTFNECVRQHRHIFRFALFINAKFRFIIIIQFIMSTLVVCFSLYQITKTTSHAKHVEMILYMLCMLTQIFFYCWYGNEVKLKSCELINDIFEMEWITLDENRKKSLMIIMRRAVVPIQITSAYIIPMNLESFTSILKTSYSTYNLLQQNVKS